MLKKEFGTTINLIENQENTGGSGGFNTGLRKALEYDYQYLMLVDNDIIMDKNAVEALSIFLDENRDVGMVGSEIYKMDQPDIIMALGSTVDYEKYKYQDCFRGCYDKDDIPEVNYCDYVPACSMMVRADVVREIGVMTESNFIYWDDIDWAKRMQLAGYKIAATTKSKIWHKGGAMRTTNTFPLYYFIRNGIYFFAKYLPESQMEHYIDTMLETIYSKLYGCYSKGKFNYMQCVMQAYDDALHGVTGRATDDKILPMIEEKNVFRQFVESDKKIIIELTDSCTKNEYEGIKSLIEFMEKTWDNKKITLSTRLCSKRIQELNKVLHIDTREGVALIDDYCPDDFDLVMRYCEHVKMVEEQILPIIYVDPYTNTINSEAEYIYFKGYDTTLDLFKRSQRELFRRGINSIRSNILH